MKTLPLNKFRLLPLFKEKFRITEDTVVAYDGNIYSNKPLYPDVLVHEKVHLAQQKKYGLSYFVKQYLNDKDFRLKVELEAYKAQLDSIKDELLREAVRKDSIIGLASGLYGKITEEEAEAMLPKPRKLDVNKLV